MANVLVHTGYLNNSSHNVKLYLSYSTSTNNAKNYSTITCGMYIVVSSGSTIGPWSDYGGSYCGTSGDTFNGSIPNMSGSRTLVSGRSFRVYHNADGSGSAGIQWKWGVRSSWGGTWEPSGTYWISLPKIPKQANITSAENFNDEENPTIKYSNPAGNSVSSLQACISFDGDKIDVPYRDIPKTGSSYTFNLTDEERDALRAGCVDAKSKSILFYVKTVLNGTTHLSKIEKAFTVVNAEPTLAPTVEDVDAAAIAITHDNTKFIKYFSDALVKVNPITKKGAEVSYCEIKHAGATFSFTEHTFYNIENGDFELVVHDTRGYAVSQKVTIPFFDYVKLTVNQDASVSTTGTATLNISGNYFNGSFGGSQNTLTLRYRYMKSGESYGDWITVTPTIYDNTYYTTVEITGLDYRSGYIFQSEAVDKAMSIMSGEYLARALPVFDWGENDFNFNVPITIEGRGYGENKILWEGALPMGAGQSINLIGGKVSEQPHGIVLVFTGFDEPTPLDQSVCTHFVSKKQVELFGGTVGHTFILGYNATLAKFGAKYLYISDEQITGHSGNTTTGTATPGFEIENPYWCLRYVIGV